jgi:hypothetical protein
MTWSSQFKIDVEMSIKGKDGQNLIESALRSFETQILRMRFNKPGIVLRVTDVKKLNDPSNESTRSRVRTFFEQLR